MGAKGLLLILFLYTALVWVASAYLFPTQVVPKGLLMTAVGLAAMLVYVIATWIWGWWRIARMKRAPKPAAALKPQATAHPDDAALEELLQQAGRELAKSPALSQSRGRKPFSGMPAYLLIGPEGSGKTSVFIQSGLEPQLLASHSRIDGAAPSSTGLANIWLAKDTLFVELGGRQFSGDSSRWEQLLRILKGGHRFPWWRRLWQEDERGLELRGVVSFCDLKTLLDAPDPSVAEQHGRLAQERLRSIGKVFGRRFPVYTIFAKTDAIPYFADYFARLPENEAAQPLGCTLPVGGGEAEGGGIWVDSETKRLLKSFNSIYYSLAEYRLSALRYENNAARKPNIFEFPRELRRIRQRPVDYLVNAFRPNPLQPGPLNRGFYFGATRKVEAGLELTQRGKGESLAIPMPRPADATELFRSEATRLFQGGTVGSGAPGAARDEPIRPLKTRWIFMGELFHRIILPDRPLATAAVIRNPRDELRRSVVSAVVTAVAALLGTVLSVSWMQNRSLLAEVKAEVARQRSARTEPGSAPSLASLKELEELRATLEKLLTERPILRWGLYAGDAVLPNVRRAYLRQLRVLVLDGAHSTIVNGLKNLPEEPDSNSTYKQVVDRLKAHLTMSSGACKLDSAALAMVLREAARQSGYILDGGRARLVDQQINFYAKEFRIDYAKEFRIDDPDRFPEHPEALRRATQYLNRVQGVEQAYQRVVDGVKKEGLRAARLAVLVPDYGRVLEGPSEVDGLFTPEGWNRFRNALESGKLLGETDPCLVGVTQQTPGAETKKALENLYARAYIKAWRQFLAAVSIRRFQNARDAAEKLEEVIGRTSPVLGLLAMTSQNTSFPTPQQKGPLGAQGLERYIPALRKAEKAVEKTAASLPASNTAAGVLTIADISSAFQPVHTVVPAGDERWINEKNKPYVDALNELRHAMLEISRRPDDQQAHDVASQARDRAMDKVGEVARSFPPTEVFGIAGEVERVLQAPIRETAKSIRSDVDGTKIQQELRTLCKSPLFQKYPFKRDGTDVALRDLSVVFAPGTGSIWRFAGSLAFTVLEGRQWKQKDGAEKKASQQLLDFLNKAQQIMVSFYSGGAEPPHFSYKLRPDFDRSRDDQVILLRIDGKLVEFNKSQRIQQEFDWPARAPAEAGAVGRSGVKGFTYGFSSHGEVWAVFRFFADAAARQIGEKFVEWRETKGPTGPRMLPLDHPVRLEIVEFPQGVDVFNPDFWAGCQCPTKATQ